MLSELAQKEYEEPWMTTKWIFLFLPVLMSTAFSPMFLILGYMAPVYSMLAINLIESQVVIFRKC